MSVCIRKLSCFIMVLCVLIVIGYSMPVSARDGDIFLEVQNGTLINISVLARENGVDPYELIEAINSQPEDGNISPWSNVEVKYDIVMEINGIDVNISETGRDCLATDTTIREAIREEPIEAEYTETLSLATSGTSTLEREEVQQLYCTYLDAATYGSNGKIPTLGISAMHINIVRTTGTRTSSNVKLGETLYMDDAVEIDGANYHMMRVEEQGTAIDKTGYGISIYFG
ncbi:MAG: hypothetical protein R3Y24_06070 [Eubacteriales bacterium]